MTAARPPGNCGNYADWFRSPSPDVKGWLSPVAALAIAAVLDTQESNGIGGSLAEIGTFLGKTFIGLALASRPDETVLGVDIFAFDTTSFRDEFDVNISRHVPGDIAERIRIKQVKSELLTPKDWAAELGTPARLVHIDGNHARKAVLYDLSLACSFLAPMGVIIIDDLFNEYFPDVTTGIIEGVRAHPQIRPVAIIPRFGKHLEGGAKLICGLRGGLAAYEQGLERWLSPLIAIRRDFLDDNPVIFIDQPQAE